MLRGIDEKHYSFVEKGQTDTLNTRAHNNCISSSINGYSGVTLSEEHSILSRFQPAVFFYLMTVDSGVGFRAHAFTESVMLTGLLFLV